MVSTGWRKLLRDAGREGVYSRKYRLKQNSKCEQHRSFRSQSRRCSLKTSQAWFRVSAHLTPLTVAEQPPTDALVRRI